VLVCRRGAVGLPRSCAHARRLGQHLAVDGHAQDKARVGVEAPRRMQCADSATWAVRGYSDAVGVRAAVKPDGDEGSTVGQPTRG
jgi:hypothetical protein